MKTRIGFVSNSSSASFVASLDKLSSEEFTKLIDYLDTDRNEDGWNYFINDEAGLIEGWTVMDNGALGDFLTENGINQVLTRGD